jgi:hypothetical protein
LPEPAIPANPSWRQEVAALYQLRCFGLRQKKSPNNLFTTIWLGQLMSDSSHESDKYQCGDMETQRNGQKESGRLEDDRCSELTFRDQK